MKSSLTPVQRRVVRQLFSERTFIDEEFRPFVNRLSVPAVDACRIFPTLGLQSLIAGFVSLPSFDQLMRSHVGSEQVGLDAIRHLRQIRLRLDNTSYRSLVRVPYKFSVGDVVRHTQFGHVGVIAARLPICFETDVWVTENLGSVDDRRLSHPWYLVLASHHVGLPAHFVRFGSQLTHVRVDSAGIGFHQMLPTFFKGFDHATGRYIPRFPGDAFQGGLQFHTDVEINSAADNSSACKLPKPRLRSLVLST